MCPDGSYTPHSGSLPALALPIAGAQRPGLVLDQITPPKAGEVIEFTKEKARVIRCQKAVRAAAQLADARATRPGFRKLKPKFLTLTYRDGDDWRAGHIAKLVNRMTKYAARKGVELVMVRAAELQERGAIHYHLVVWIPYGFRFPKLDDAGWWPHGMTRWGTRSKRDMKNPGAYLAKYASKGGEPVDGHSFPKGARMHGAVGLTSSERQLKQFACRPRWLQKACGDVYQPLSRVGGGWWLLEGTGELVRSPWVPEVIGYGRVRLRLREAM